MTAAKPSNLFEIASDAEFQSKCNEAGSKLIIIDFYADWCQPCKNIAPVVESYARKFNKAHFFKVNVEKCELTAQRYGVRSMPTFILLRSNTKLEEFKGADAIKLQDMIKKHYVDDNEDEGSGVPGYINLNSMINKARSECLNEKEDHTFTDCLGKDDKYLESDCDEQLIIAIEFQQNVKLHSLKIQGPPVNGPKTVKLFINEPSTMDFDMAERGDPLQLLELTEEDIKPNVIIPLRFVKFQNVSKITLFVKDNQGDEETTCINHLAFIGCPVDTTNMEEFKRVAGKKGESH